MDYEKLYNYMMNNVYGKDKPKEETLKTFHNNIGTQVHVPKLLAEIGKVRPIRDDKGFSAESTLDMLLDKHPQLYYGLYFLAHYTTASNFKLGINKKDKPFYCRLVPLGLSAYKKYQNIGYDEWNKADSYLPVLIGQALYVSITREELKGFECTPEFRDQVIESAKRANSNPIATSCSFRKIDYNGIAFAPYEASKYILSQTWMAHHTNRNEYMILDLENWDNMPEPLDEVIDDVEDGRDDLSWMLA